MLHCDSDTAKCVCYLKCENINQEEREMEEARSNRENSNILIPSSVGLGILNITGKGLG
jgi:hypothetical protein